MGTTSIVTEADLDDEAVALVRLPPSPTIEPSTPSPLSTLTSLSSPRPQTTTTTPSVHTPVPAPASSSSQSLVSSRLDDRAAVAAAAATTSAIPTPKSTTASDTPPPPTSQSGERPRGNPQVTDNCMFCTPETAPPVENLEWIQCNGCKRWAHTQCTGLPRSINIQTIDKFHCKRCEKTRGPTTFRGPPRKSERSHVNIDYTSLNLGDTTTILPDQHAYNAFFEGDSPRRFAPDRFKRMYGYELTKEWAEETGCKEPVVIPRGQEAGMGMVMPKDLTVSKVAELVGQDTKVEVIDVPTQKEAPNWKLKQWAEYYNTPADERDRVRNVISLEVSSSALGAQVVRPQFVRDLDLIEKVWPHHLRPPSLPGAANPNYTAYSLPLSTNLPSHITFPKVTLYCLMSVARSYTDFHVDFGGSSVFYHILRGKKTFLFIEPSPTNLRRYESWCGDSEQSKRFLGEEVRECVRVDLSEGDTMIIPSGWIHAVYTPSDSLVLGGNFLTPLHMPSQLQIANIETRTRVPKKFRFPFFDLAMWYTAQYYLDQPRPRIEMSSYEIGGLRELAEWTWKKGKLRTQQLSKGPDNHRAKVEVPPGWDVVDVATRFIRWVYESEEGTLDEDVPLWVKNEVLGMKNETPVSQGRKRRREDGVGTGAGETPTPRKYTRRTGKKEEERMAADAVMTDAIPRQDHRIEHVTVTRPVTSYASISSPCITQYPSITYPVPRPPVITTILSTAPSAGSPLNIFKPYSSTPTKLLQPKGPSFLSLIKSTCRPYLLRPTTLLEEIKVEDEPQILSTTPQGGTGLDVLSLAIDLQTKLPTNNATSPASTLTVYSPSDSRVRLPTPPSQSPPPTGSREAALGLRSRSNSPTAEGSAKKKKKKSSSGGGGAGDGAATKKRKSETPRLKALGRHGLDEVEAKRLEGLFTLEEMADLRKKRRRASGYLFSVQSLKRELERMGREY